MTPHERMEKLDENGDAYEVTITTPTDTYLRAPVMHHSERWICTAQGSEAPEVWTNMEKVDRIVIHILP